MAATSARPWGLPLVLLVAGCGGADVAPPDRRVRDTVADFARATQARDYSGICTRILAPELVEQVTSIGLPCPVALREGLGAVREPRLTVGAVRVAGDRATAEVSTSAEGQAPSRDTIELSLGRDGWRITSLAGP